MSAVQRQGARRVAAWILCVLAQAGAANGQFESTLSSGEILAGFSSPSASTTIVSQGPVFLADAPTIATMRVGFNVNADAEPGFVSPEVGILSYDVRFTLDHPHSFGLRLDFNLVGELMRNPDQDGCLGSMSLEDISITNLERLGVRAAQIPINVVLEGASLDLADTTAAIALARQASVRLNFTDEPIETTAYRLTFIVSATAISQSCEVSARFGAQNGSTTSCDACVYPGLGDRIQEQDGLFITASVDSRCGDGALDADESCDLGASNGQVGACCDTFCRFAPSSVVCRPAAGECDQAESCSGDSGVCPDDGKQSPDTPCTDDGAGCTADVCDAAGACTHPLRADTVCDDSGCICDNDGLFCNGKVRCNGSGGGLCIVLPPPCAEDDTCDEEHDVCVTPFGTATPAQGSPTPTPLPGTPTATSVGATPIPTSTAIPGLCAGDCNADGRVVVNELVLGVNIALGTQPASACPAFDSNGDSRVVISELVAAVSNALAGCRP